MRPKQDQPLTLHGVADAFGLQALAIFDERKVPLLLMRASIYRHRHCMYFQATIADVDVKKIKGLVKKDARDEALKLLKERALVINIPKEFLDSWELIPDHRLDPWKDYAVRN